MSNHGSGKDISNKEAPGGAPNGAAAAAGNPNGIHAQEHSCEICGMSGLSDDAMREHTRQCHVEGSAQCPFCGLSGVPAAELLLHVNQAHLDYLTPENELMSFIDDQTPSIDGDSDSISDCRGFSPSITSELLTPVSNTNSKPSISNGSSMTNSSGQQLPNGTSSHSKISSSMSTSATSTCSRSSIGSQQNGISNGSTSASSSSNNHMSGASSKVNQQQLLNNHQHPEVTITSTSNKSCDMLNDGKEVVMNGGGEGCTSGVVAGASGTSTVNGTGAGAGGQGSPLRSQLGLKLKSHKPIATTTTKPSPLQCLLCPYTTENPSVLEEHINRSHFDPLSPSINNGASGNSHVDTLSALQCPICARTFESGSDLELHVNIEHRDILSPAKADRQNGGTPAAAAVNGSLTGSLCPVCGISFDHMKTADMEIHIEKHFSKSPQNLNPKEPDLEKQAQKLREQREFEMLRAQYGMDDQGNFREQSAAAMQRAVYAGEMSVADYYERQVGLRAAESHGVDDGSSCTKSVSPRVLALSSSSPNVLKTYVCSSVDHYASSYGDKGWGCGYRNLQMMLSSLLQNTAYNEALYSAWGSHGPARTAMPSISRLQRMVEAAWAQGFDIQGSEQLGCKLYNTRKWIGATEIVTVLSWLRIRCELVDFHRPTSSDGRHPELFNWVLRYFEEPRIHTPPLYLQHQGHSRTIVGIEQRTSGLSLLVLDPSHGPRQVAALGSSQDSLRLIRKNSAAMRAPQYQVVAVKGLIETEEQYQASKVLRSHRIPPDR
ncbi:AAEL013635-PA [Aedes aegypti]|uniref:Zinc finger-containing ubiquitin peptidase 1 n=2 Tax=Aedes aegypti TaxID=7159 RepID=Q16IJ2_AEDAE|nr:zinc finger with UFM1-specific peptidase domain protein [Aedes aegypti]XP_021701540.1 zinc finger with UFM1-specific peptidase domain protein [Aedes aegypti]XP_021701541.1 zinc finger with UFM1-specific peptidase domain protein [Aedes aegypti]EAT34090.1 AAEL013635-PA [Aedes aegypti]